MLINFSKSDISDYLDKVKECITSGKTLISQNRNRMDNIKFMRRFNLDPEDVYAYVEGLEVEDFCHGLQNDSEDPRYRDEVLYVFSKSLTLEEAGIEKNIKVYIKFNLIEMATDRLIMVSFHELKWSITHLFK